MAACEGLQQIFKKSLPENPTLLESLSWNHMIKPTKPNEQDSSPLTEIFGELHFKENPKPLNQESLQLCTEGLGFESSADVEELKSDAKIDGWGEKGESTVLQYDQNVGSGEAVRRVRKSGGEFPPPISCIGESGKPWVWFKSYRQNGRFVLKEIRVPNQEFLHASREDGRLKLQFLQAEGENDEEDYDEEDCDEEDYDEEEEEEEEEEEMMGEMKY